MARAYDLVRLWVGVAVLLVTAGCATDYSPVEVVADKDVDFSQYRTFEIEALILDSMGEFEGQQDLLVNQMIGQSLGKSLIHKGLEQEKGGSRACEDGFWRVVNPWRVGL